MELTMAEFAAFSTKSKCQILNYKATHVSCISTCMYDLQLYNMDGDYYVAHVCRTSNKTEKIEVYSTKISIKHRVYGNVFCTQT